MNQNKSDANQDRTKASEFPSLIFKGFFMGSADVVPGVSGGTMALIMGIYTRLINAIKSADSVFFGHLIKLRIMPALRHIHLMFLIPLLIGVALAIVFFTRIVPLPQLMYTNPEPVYGVFFGLIAGSVWLLYRSLEKVRWQEIAFVVLGTAIGYWVVTLVPTDTPENALFVFFSGSVAITAMVLPGISGSFILLILRKYDYILGQFALLGTDRTMDAILVLIPFGLGMIAGIMVFSRLLSWLLDRYYLPTVSVLIGFMIGSLFIIWPFQDREFYESVRTEIVNKNDDIAVSLMEDPEDEKGMEYRKIGDMVNPEASADQQRVEIITVKKKLISSEPFLPSWQKADQDQRLTSGQNSIIYGGSTMFAGLLLVMLLGRIADIKLKD